MLNAEGIEEREVHFHDFIVEKAVEMAVVLIDIERFVLCLRLDGQGSQQHHSEAGKKSEVSHRFISLMVSLPAFTKYTPAGRWAMERVSG